MAGGSIPVKHPHVGLLEVCVCHPTPAAPGVSLHAGGAASGVRFAKSMASAQTCSGARSRRTVQEMHRPDGRPWSAGGRRAVPEAGSGRQGGHIPGRQPAMGEAALPPLSPSARLTHGQAAPPGTLSGMSRATRRPLPAECLPPTKPRSPLPLRVASSVSLGPGRIWLDRYLICVCPWWWCLPLAQRTRGRRKQPDRTAQPGCRGHRRPPWRRNYAAPTASGGRCRSGCGPPRTPAEELCATTTPMSRRYPTSHGPAPYTGVNP